MVHPGDTESHQFKHYHTIQCNKHAINFQMAEL